AIGSPRTDRNRNVRYISTRDPRAEPRFLSFSETLLAGLAEDGGLYIPDGLPELRADELRGYAGLPYAELAARLVSFFSGDDFSSEELQRLTAEAYGKFRHATVAPLVLLDERL